MFDLFGCFHKRGSGTRVCVACGQPAIYRHCAVCSRRIWRETADETARAGELATHIGEQPTAPMAVITPPAQGAQSTEVAVDYLASLPAAPVVPDDEPFDEPFTEPAVTTAYQELPPVMSTPHIDEFSELVVRMRLSPEAIPPIRTDWSGCCLWCAREMRELTDDTYTHTPRQAVITTCTRHHDGLLALNADLRSGGYRTRFDERPEGQDGGAA